MMAGCVLLCSTFKGRRMHCKHEGASHWTLKCNGTAPTSSFHKLVQHVISDFACLDKGENVKEVALVMWLACGTMSWHPCTLHSLCVNAHKDVVRLSPCCRPCRPSCPCRPVDVIRKASAYGLQAILRRQLQLQCNCSAIAEVQLQGSIAGKP